MTIATQDYFAAGYFLSRYIGPQDCTGLELRRVSLATDHSPRKFFPHAWALSWCHGSRAERVEAAAVFGIAEPELDDVIAWADRSFDSVFGAWSVFFELEGARAAARSMLKKAADLELWGVGLHRDLLSEYCEASKPPAPEPGYAPIGASGVHVAACVHSAPLAEGGTVLGHELLIDDPASCFDSPESRHLDERELFRSVGIVPNSYGLVDSFEEALACCGYLDSHAAETPHRIIGWRPWLIVRYPL